MVGRTIHEDAASVRAEWERWPQDHNGFAIRRRLGDYSINIKRSKQPVIAFVSDNCWTGSCPRCNDGVPTWPGENDEGCCLGCGTVYPIVYPDGEELEAGVTALLARPARNRHWHPAREGADDLRAENLQHGYHPTKPLAEQQLTDDEMIARFLDREGEVGIDFLKRRGALPDDEAAELNALLMKAGAMP